MYHKSHDVYGTPLPLDINHLSDLEPKLKKLPSNERELVLGYLHRSNGDVLPTQFADPDSPFTARTFREAIELQKKYLAQQSIDDAKMADRRQAREEALKPLRDALEIIIVKREIVPKSRMYESAEIVTANTLSKRPTSNNDTPVLIETYRIRNRSGKAIRAFKASMNIYKADTKPEEGHFTIGGCYINDNQPLQIDERRTVRCGGKPASKADEAYVDMTESQLEIDWAPKRIDFEDHTVLKYDGY